MYLHTYLCKYSVYISVCIYTDKHFAQQRTSLLCSRVACLQELQKAMIEYSEGLSLTCQRRDVVLQRHVASCQKLDILEYQHCVYRYIYIYRYGVGTIENNSKQMTCPFQKLCQLPDLFTGYIYTSIQVNKRV